jgi:hypothetical protein
LVSLSASTECTSEIIDAFSRANYVFPECFSWISYPIAAEPFGLTKNGEGADLPQYRAYDDSKIEEVRGGDEGASPIRVVGRF